MPPPPPSRWTLGRVLAGTCCLLALLPHIVLSACPPSWAAWGDSCYFLSATQWDYETSRTMCAKRGGDLASFENVQEREFLISLIVPLRETFWIGAKRQDGQWIWSDGVTPGPDDDSIKNWRDNCPEGCVGDCVQMNHWDGLWTNVGCDWSARGICKRSNKIVDLCDYEGGWHPYDGVCYKYSTTKRSWQDANRECAAGNGRLAKMNTQAKFAIMEEIVACKDFQAGVWLGLSDTSSAEGTLDWIDGEKLSDTNWDDGQPLLMSAVGGNCVKSLPLSDFKWRVDICERENEFLCEKSQGTCTDAWQDKGNGFCYLLVGVAAEHRRTWSDAEAYCQASGANGHLVSVIDEQQQAVLRSISAEAALSTIYIGLSDLVTDNVLLWSDNQTVTYNNPGIQENIVRRPDCGFVSSQDEQALWHTAYCFLPHAFICQLPIHSAALTPLQPDDWICPDGWETDHVEGRCYQVFEDLVTYQVAKSRCASGPGSIVTVLNPRQQSFVTALLQARTWFGLEYQGGGRYEWSDGSPFVFECWTSGTEGPSNANGARCTTMRISSGPRGEWMDTSCDQDRPFICAMNATHSTATPTVPTPTVPWHPQCGPGWSFDVYGQGCYMLVREELTWEEAELSCQRQGANLVSIHSLNEQNYINALVMQREGWISFWIGANDIDTSSGWKWTDRSPFYFWNWNSGEPNNQGGTEFCVEMSADMLGRWNDINCDRKFSYICRKSATTATPPPGLTPTSPPATCDNGRELVSGHHYVRDSAIVASSFADGRPASRARIYAGAGSWTAATGDTAPWVGVHFSHYVIVTGVRIAGAGDRDEYVMDFRLSYRLQSGSFYEYYRDATGVVVVFPGNADSNTVRTHAFSPGTEILAHGVRLHPGSVRGTASMRFELLGCKWEACVPQLLVSGESMVPDDRMTASGQWDEFHAPTRARMNSQGPDNDNNWLYRGGWVANSPWSDQQWIQVEFDTTMALYAIQTKGRLDYPQWINHYWLRYTDNLAQWETYQDPYGTDKVFTGNSDSDSLVTNYLDANVYNVRYARIYPQAWTNGVSCRLEILGCSSHRDGCSDIPLITGTNNYVPNSRLSASSSLDEMISGPARSRLNQRASGNLYGAWVPVTNNENQWIQADLGRPSLVMAVATQGRQETKMYVTTYKLSSSQLGENFDEYQENGNTKIFDANYETMQGYVHKYYLNNPLAARFVRLHPLTWNVSIALRWEIYACAGWSAPSIVGCYADDAGNRDLGGPSIALTPEGMTQLACVDFCRSQNYLYAGVQLGEACYCGNAYGRLGLSNACNMPCRGDPTGETICGGVSANTILHTGIFSPDQVLGCYGDNADRDMPYEHYLSIPGGNTQQYCAIHCFNKGYRFAGAQYGSECFCGNSYGRYGLSSYCNMTCSGDRTGQTMCGGEWSNTVLSTGLAEDHPRCRDGWIPFGEHCYQFSTDRLTWYQARSACAIQGAELATVNYEQVNDFIAARVAEQRLDVWLGLHCLTNNNYFEWVSGEPVLYTNWNRREPNNWANNEDCVEMYQSGKWNDDPCGEGNSNGYVCRTLKEEILDPATPTPDPSCPQGFSGYRWKCYMANRAERWSWAQAKSQCEGLGGTLARIEDQMEQAFLSSTFGLTPGTYWTDLAERDEGFRYSNGLAPTFTHWGQEEPKSVPGGGCVVVNMDEHGMWHNFDCPTKDKTMSICEVARKDQTRPTVQPTNPAQGSCFNGWVETVDRQSCLQISAVLANQRKTWVDAYAACRDMGADLVSIHSREENNNILIQTNGKVGDFWIGLNARDNSAGFVWSDGTPVDFESWSGPGLLADGLDCVDIYAATATWNKRSCVETRNWICKIHKGTVPIVTTTTAPPSAGPPGSCSPDNDDWKFFNDKCYLFTGFFTGSPGANYGWMDAEHTCKTFGGNLVAIHTEQENRFLEGQARALSIGDLQIWIGLTDMDPPNSWQWSDGSIVDYRNWGQGEPNNEGGMELCVGMELRDGMFGQWNDLHCSNSRPFICAKNKGNPPISTPTPPPMPGFCPAGYLTFGNKCFRFHDDKVDWGRAHQLCLAESGGGLYSLATISDAWEQAFLTSNLRNQGSPRHWIGLHQYHGDNGEFGWIDNSRMTYANWAPGEPNGGASEACVQMYTEPFRMGLWNDENCALDLAYLCMRMRDPSLTATAEPPPVNSCPDGFSQWEGNCYRVDGTARSWQAAEDQCKQAGGHLTSVADRAEQGFIMLMLRDMSADLWIGLRSEKATPGRYLWIDDSTVQYTNWGSSYPEVRDGGCARLDFSLQGAWADRACESTYGSICKITRVPPPYTQRPGGGSCASDSAGDNWVEFGSHCYLFRNMERVTASTASLQCTMVGAYLTSVHSDDENKFILDHFSIQTVQRQWIGLMKTSQGGFVWADGSSVGYYNWEDGEPNDDDRSNEEDCTEMIVSNGRWNDIKCTNLNGYVCRKRQMDSEDGPTPVQTPPPTVPTTTTALPPPSTVSITSAVTASQSTPRNTVLPPTIGRTLALKQPMSLTSGGVVGVVFAVLIMSLAALLVALVVLKRRGALPNFDSTTGGIDNPAYGGGAKAGTAFDVQGVVRFSGETNA